MRLQNIAQIGLFSTGNLQLSPRRENRHLDHDLSVGAESFQVSNASCFRFAGEVLERRDKKLEDTTHTIDVCHDTGGDERGADIDSFCCQLRG